MTVDEEEENYGGGENWALCILAVACGNESVSWESKNVE